MYLFDCYKKNVGFVVLLYYSCGLLFLDYNL